MFTGIIIEESLTNPRVLKEVATTDIRIRVFKRGDLHNGVNQWIIREVTVPPNKAEAIANSLSHALNPKYPWYAHFKNPTTHYFIFPQKVFMVDRFSKVQYEQMQRYAEGLGLSASAFQPSRPLKEWEF